MSHRSSALNKKYFEALTFILSLASYYDFYLFCTKFRSCGKRQWYESCGRSTTEGLERRYFCENLPMPL